MVPKKYKDLVSKYKTYIIWFENPTFPLYPKVKFLDTATHCGVVGDAFVPALYEAFERYSILSIPQHMPYAESSYNDLIGNGLEALDPTEFWHYSEQQLSNNKLLKMELDSNLKWVKVNSTNGKYILIPEDFVYINTLIPSSYTNNTTSGSAAHNNEESSHLNAFLELIERDNTIRHWASFNSVDHIYIESLPTYAITVANALDELGYDMLVLNSSLYQGITVLEILLVNKEDKFPKAIISSAAGLTPMKALG
jgi:thiazole/oxazole-forming peptide maturase SagD family component